MKSVGLRNFKANVVLSNEVLNLPHFPAGLYRY